VREDRSSPAAGRILPGLAPGRPGDPGLFGPGSVAWRVNGEAALILAGPRALLMQIADPLVAAGVARHSGFPAGAYRRLASTMEAMLAISFGDSEQAREAADRVTAVHRAVSGRSASGAAYSALDPPLLAWVWATLVDSALVAYRRFVGRLADAEQEAYVLEMHRLAVAMRTPEEVLPPSLEAFRTMVGETAARLEVSEDARRLVPAILTPPMPLPLRPLAFAQRQVTVGLLPPALRAAYGLSWDPLREAGLGASALALRTALRLTPSALRRAPHARLAERRAAS
jgi:uncharacterized protein (DUF2236 family)